MGFAKVVELDRDVHYTESNIFEDSAIPREKHEADDPISVPASLV
jgi:hypothetical protein